MTKEKKNKFRLFEQWGGDDKVFRLAKFAIGWVAAIVIAWIIFRA